MADVLEARANMVQAAIAKWPGAFNDNIGHQATVTVLMALRDGFMAASLHGEGSAT